MPRKVAKVYLRPFWARTLEFLCERLDLGESELLRIAFIEFVDKYGIIEDRIRGYKKES